MNKVYVNIYVPMINQNYYVFLPVNEFIWKIKNLVSKSICDINEIDFSVEDKYVLVNKISGNIYEDNQILLNTDIRNCTELLLIKII